MPWRCRRVARRRAVDSVVSGASSAPAAGSSAYTRPSRCWASAPGNSSRDRGDDVARAVGAQLGAQHDDAARQVAAEPPGTAHDLARVQVGPRAQVLQERAAQVLLDLVPGLLDGDLGERRDRRQVQVLRGLRAAARARAGHQRDDPDDVVARRDRRLGHERGRHLDGPVLHAVGGVAAQRRQGGRGGRGGRSRHRHAEPRHDDGHRPPGRVAGQLGDAAEALAAEHRLDHAQMNGAQPSDERAAPAAIGVGRAGGSPVVPRRRAPDHQWPTARRGGGRRVGVRLQDLLAGLAGPDAVGLLDRKHEHLAVADGAGAAVLQDRVHDRLHVARRDDALDLDLGAEVVRDLRPAVLLGDALLPAGPLHLADGQRGEAERQQLGADGLERLVPDDADDDLHVTGASWLGGWRRLGDGGA